MAVINNPEMTLGEYAEYWLQSAGDLSKYDRYDPDVMELYRRVYDRYFSESIRGLRLAEIDIKSIKQIWNDICEEYRLQPGGSTMRSVRNLLHAMFRYSSVSDPNGKSITGKIRYPRRVIQPTAVPEREDIRLLLTMEDMPGLIICRTALCLGTKIGEILCMKKRDLNTGDRKIRITKTITYRQNNREVFSEKNLEGRPRYREICYPAIYEDYLFPWLEKREAWKRDCVGAGCWDEDYLFCLEDGGNITISRYYHWFEKIRDKLEKPGICMEGIRRAHELLMLKLSGGNEALVYAMCGSLPESERIR